MNERIKELATEVGISIDYLTNTNQIELIEKFAQLIIWECTGICEDIGTEGDGQHCVDAINDYFSN